MVDDNARVEHVNKGKTCKVAGCEVGALAKGLCRLHWERQHRTGTTDAPPRRVGSLNPNWRGDEIAYSAAHLRLAAMPRPDACEMCDARGVRFEWALRPGVPRDGLPVSPQGYSYSLDPRHYFNLCKPCHNRLDLGRDECRRGHPLSGDNLYIQPSNGKRFCLECQRRRGAERRARERARKAAS